MTDKKGVPRLCTTGCIQTECLGRRGIQKDVKFKLLKGNSFSHSVQLDCGMYVMQLPAGQDVISKEQNVALGVCRFAIAGGICR